MRHRFAASARRMPMSLAPRFNLRSARGVKPFNSHHHSIARAATFNFVIIQVLRLAAQHSNAHGWAFTPPKTTRSRRNIPLPASVVITLAAHQRQQSEERLKAGAEYQNYDLVFASREGTPIMMRNLLRRHFKPILERAELSNSIRLYDLRHSCATLLLAANEHPKVVSERLGHASITLTLDTYSHVLPSMQQAASEKLESLLFTKTGTQ